eukprot:3934965-Rhodomonas_salina.1
MADGPAGTAPAGTVVEWLECCRQQCSESLCKCLLLLTPSRAERPGSAEAQNDPVAVSARRLRTAEGRRDVAEARLEDAKQSGNQAAVEEAKVGLAEAK